MKKKKVHIPVDRIFLDKDRSMIEARMLVNSRRIDMSIQECAEEIYSHAIMFYWAMWLKEKLHINWKWLIKHANPIDMEDGGDTKHRKIIYKLIWLMIPSR